MSKSVACPTCGRTLNQVRITWTKETFESFVIKEPQEVGGCWMWQGRKDRLGYGKLHDKESKIDKAHRLSFKLYKFDPKGLFVLHKCDRPQCVNPDHLNVGDHGNNHEDRVRRSRFGAIKSGKHFHRALSQELAEDYYSGIGYNDLEITNLTNSFSKGDD